MSDGELTNRERGELARPALELFRDAHYFNENDSLEDPLCDLIADLLHLARAEGMDPDAQLERARTNFEFEEAEELVENIKRPAKKKKPTKKGKRK